MKYFIFSIVIHFFSFAIIIYKTNTSDILFKTECMQKVFDANYFKIQKNIEKDDLSNLETKKYKVPHQDGEKINNDLSELENIKKTKINIEQLNNPLENKDVIGNKNVFETKIYNFKHEKILFQKIRKLFFIKKSIRNKDKYIEVLLILDEKGKIKSFRFINTSVENRDYYDSLRKLLNSKLFSGYSNKNLQNKKLLFKFNCN